MKKVLPFIFPLIALIIVGFLAYRWYSLNTANRPGANGEIGEGVQIEDLSTAEQEQIIRGTGDFQRVELQGEAETRGEIRYEVENNRVRFSVVADLPPAQGGVYTAWLRTPGSEQTRKAFLLEASKGGFVGSAAVSADVLPLEVIVSREQNDDDTLETVVLRGTVNQETQEGE
jgi:hypothetical protein